MKDTLIQRWDHFLEKITIRFEESLIQGKAAVMESLEDNDYDYYASYRALRAIEMQIRSSLIEKIDITWIEQVEPSMRADGGIYWADESRKGYRLQDELSDRLSVWVNITEGHLSQKYYDHAIQLIHQDFKCTQCHAPLEVKKNFFLSQYVTCGYCNTVNTFEPQTKYATIGWNIINNIAALHSMEAYDAVRKTPREDRRAYEQALRNYYEKYFDERIKLMPHSAATRERDIELEIKKMM